MIWARKPLLLVRLRDGDLVEIDPVGLWIAGGVPEELIIRSDGRRPIPLLAGPGRIALAGVDDRAREVVRERDHFPPFPPTACKVTAGLAVAWVADE